MWHFCLRTPKLLLLNHRKVFVFLYTNHLLSISIRYMSIFYCYHPNCVFVTRGTVLDHIGGKKSIYIVERFPAVASGLAGRTPDIINTI